MKILELFAGKQSFGSVGSLLNHEVYSSDIKALKGIDYVCDILDFDVKKVPFVPDVIWASPDCATWSKASGNFHFNARSLNPNTDKARLAFKHIDKMLAIVKHFESINPRLIYFIENPMGKLYHYLMPGSLFQKVPYVYALNQCDYGREFRKPTHLFSNASNFVVKPRSSNYRNGVYQNVILTNKGYYRRAEIAKELCLAVLSYCNATVIGK